MIIGLMGYAQSGKDTVAAQLVAEHGFERIAFADTLRDCLYALNPWIKSVPLQRLVNSNGWDATKRDAEVRGLLQRLGTEVGRNILGDSIWVDTALRKVKDGDYVISDVRFPNEYFAISERGGRLLRIKRPGTEPINAHPSETALDHIASESIRNDGTLEDLHGKVQAWLTQ